MEDPNTQRLNFQYKALKNTKPQPLTYYDDQSHTELSIPNITKKFSLSSCYWAFKNPVTSMSLVRTLNNDFILATGTFSNLTKVFILKDDIPFIDESNVFELKQNNGAYKVLDIDVHPNFMNIAPGNGKIVTAASDGLLRLWTCDIDKGNDQLCQIYDIGSKKVTRTKFISPYNVFASITTEGHLKITDIEKSMNLLELMKNEIELTSIAIHPCQNLIYTGDKLGYGVVWDLRNGKYICDFNNLVNFDNSQANNKTDIFNYTFKTFKINNYHKDRITRSDFDTRGVLLTTGSDDHFSFIWDLRKQKLIQQIPAHNSRLIQSKFTTNSNVLMTAAIDGSVKFWDWYTLTILNEIETNNPKTTCVAFDQLSNVIFTSDLDKKLSIFT